MIIACDGDGIVCNLHEPWYARYNRDYDDNLTMERVVSWDVHKYVKPECGKKIYDYLRDPNLYDDVLPIAGALEGITQIRAMGHQVFFVTACEYGMVDQKARWFERHGFSEQFQGGRSLPKDFVPIQDKTLLDARMLIDDGAHNVRAWVEQKQRLAILLDYPHNRSLDDEVPSAFWSRARRVRDWPGIVRYVENWGAL
jgi:5'-nucleotidase